MPSFFRFRLSLVIIICAGMLLFLACSVHAQSLLFIRHGALWFSDTHGNKQRKLPFFDGKEIESVALSPDGRLAVVACGRDSLTGLSHIFSLQLGKTFALPVRMENLRAAYCPSFSPDGRSIVLVGASQCRTTKEAYPITLCTMSISIVHLNSGKVTNVLSTPNVVLDTGYVYSNPVFSPNGMQIAYQASGSDVSGGFTVVDLTGRVLFQYPLSGSGYPPFWKPEFITADRIVCWSPDASGGGDNFIYEVRMPCGSARKLAKGANPALVDNGKAIVFERWAECGDDRSPCNLWRLDLSKGAREVKILEDARLPAGSAM